MPVKAAVVRVWRLRPGGDMALAARRRRPLRAARRVPTVHQTHPMPPRVRGRIAISAAVSYAHFGCNKGTVMILGMSIQTFTVLHVVISLIGIVTGLIVLFGMF